MSGGIKVIGVRQPSAGAAVTVVAEGWTGKWHGAANVHGSQGAVSTRPYLSIFETGAKGLAVQALGIYVGTAGDGGSTARLCIYEVNPVSKRIGGLIVDGGNVATSTLGAKSVVIDEVLPEIVALCLIPTFSTTSPLFYSIGGQLSNVPQNNLSDAAHVGYTADNVAGAAPANLSNIVLSNGWIPRVKVQMA